MGKHGKTRGNIYSLSYATFSVVERLSYKYFHNKVHYSMHFSLNQLYSGLLRIMHFDWLSYLLSSDRLLVAKRVYFQIQNNGGELMFLVSST